MSHEFSTDSDVSYPQSLYFAGGFGYDQQRNSRVSGYIADTYGYEALPSLPDQDLGNMNPNFTVIANGVSREVTRREALRLTGREEITAISSKYQETRAAELAAMLKRERPLGALAIFQSADAINGLKAMAEEPDLIDHAILAYPAGVIRQPQFLKASLGVLKSGVSIRRSAEQTYQNNFEGDKKGRRSKAAANLVVASSVALTDQGELLAGIRSNRDSPGISMVLGMRDWMIRPERVISSLPSQDAVDSLLITDQPHGLNGRKNELKAWLDLVPAMAEARVARNEGKDNGLPLKERIHFFGNVALRDRIEILALADKVKPVR